MCSLASAYGMLVNRFLGVNPVQVPTIQKSVVQNLAQTEAVAEPENTSTPSFRQTEKEPAWSAPVETDQPEGQKRGFVLPVVAGIIAVLACVGVWIFRKHG